MSAVDIALPRLQSEEGFRATVYRDTAGHQTIGYGFNLDAGISKRAATALLQEQATERHEALWAYPWYVALDDLRQSAILDIAFNEGLGGLLKFPHMISALAAKDWQTASDECKVQDPRLEGRYAALAHILLTGAT